MEMKTNEEVREEILKAALADLKARVTEVVSDIAGDLYTDYLPHVQADTESNISFRVRGAVCNLIAGKFERISETGVSVSDGYGANHYVSLTSYSDMVKPLCDQLGEAIKGTRIIQLELEVKRLKEALSEAYRWS